MAMTTGRNASGHGSLRSSVPPRYSVAMPTYIGLRVRRYGPRITNAAVGLVGLGEVPARDEESPADDARDGRRLRPQAYRPESVGAVPRGEPAGVDEWWGEPDTGGICRRVGHGGAPFDGYASALQPAHDPHRQKYDGAEGGHAKCPVDAGEHRQDDGEVRSQAGHEHRQQAVPQRRCEGERDQGARRGQPGDARERRDYGAPYGEQAGDENPVAPVPFILCFDVGQHGWWEQPPAGRPLEEIASVAACQPVDQGRRADVRYPRETEHRPGVEPAPPGEERPERDGGVSGQRRNEGLERRERRDQSVQRCGRQALEEREEIAQARACSFSDTASTATPSPLPIQPIPSFVFALTEMVEYPLTSAPARFSRMSST